MPHPFNMRTLLLALACLLAFGCTDPKLDHEPAPDVVVAYQAPAADPVEVTSVDRLRATWTVSDAFSADELEAILVAADNWGTVTGGRVRLELVVAPLLEPAPWTITRADLSGADANGLTTTAPNGDAWMQIDADNYEGDECVGRVWFVAAHEFGHALGIHAHGPDGVMHTGAGAVSCDATYSKSDLALFAEANP